MKKILFVSALTLTITAMFHFTNNRATVPGDLRDAVGMDDGSSASEDLENASKDVQIPDAEPAIPSAQADDMNERDRVCAMALKSDTEAPRSYTDMLAEIFMEAGRPCNLFLNNRVYAGRAFLKGNGGQPSAATLAIAAVPSEAGGSSSPVHKAIIKYSSGERVDLYDDGLFSESDLSEAKTIGHEISDNGVYSFTAFTEKRVIDGEPCVISYAIRYADGYLVVRSSSKTHDEYNGYLYFFKNVTDPRHAPDDWKNSAR